jgi:hypothetical protein
MNKSREVKSGSAAKVQWWKFQLSKPRDKFAAKKPIASQTAITKIAIILRRLLLNQIISSRAAPFVYPRASPKPRNSALPRALITSCAIVTNTGSFNPGTKAWVVCSDAVERTRQMQHDINNGNA